jgi:hypothetical protein
LSRLRELLTALGKPDERLSDTEVSLDQHKKLASPFRFDLTKKISPPFILSRISFIIFNPLLNFFKLHVKFFFQFFKEFYFQKNKNDAKELLFFRGTNLSDLYMLNPIYQNSKNLQLERGPVL